MIWQVPTPTAVTVPLELTVATVSSLEVHVTSRFVAVQGETVAYRLPELPFHKVRSGREICTLLTESVGAAQLPPEVPDLSGMIREVISLRRSLCCLTA